MNLAASIELFAYGTSQGVTKSWDTRGRKVASDLLEHHDRLKNLSTRSNYSPAAEEAWVKMFIKQLPELRERALKEVQKLQGYRSQFVSKSLESMGKELLHAESAFHKNDMPSAAIHAEHALMDFHEAINHMERMN